MVEYPSGGDLGKVPIKVWVFHDGKLENKFEIHCITDGTFQTEYQPITNKAGDYIVVSHFASSHERDKDEKEEEVVSGLGRLTSWGQNC